MKLRSSSLLILILITACQKEILSIPIESQKPIEVYFCPDDDCGNILNDHLDKAGYSIHCAFFDLDLEDIISTLEKKSRTIDVRLVIDNDNYLDTDIKVIFDDDRQLSHNKFCIIDKKRITTGSFNPTKNGNEKNNNNLLIIESPALAENYEHEFTELWTKNFGKGNKVGNAMIIHNNKQIENYFCPEDSCKEHLISKILDAKKCIYFMVFTFTDQDVADAILFSNVTDIKGVMDNMQAGGKYSQFERLKGFGIDVKKDSNKAGFLHHKVFIIDNETVVTGSYNPTSAGDTKNDENMLIIHDKRIAEKFLEEFEKLY